MPKTKVAVIFGGQSSEHEVSRVSAQSVLSNIDRDQFEVMMVGITRQGQWRLYHGPAEHITSDEWVEDSTTFEFPPRNIDVIFPVLHGTNGEDGTIQGFFELWGIPYVGSGVLGSALGMDKAYSKIIFEKAGIPQGKYMTFTRNAILNNPASITAQVEYLLPYPCFIKPSNAGSSVGVSKAHNREELFIGLRQAAKYDRKVLVEEFINAREIECAILGNNDPVASVIGEVIPCNEFYDYKAKYVDNKSQIRIPADLPHATIELIRSYAVQAFKALDCCGLSRVDFFVHKETGGVYINEINTMPGFTSISMYPKLWEASGIPYRDLITRLIELALQQFRDNKKETGL